MTDNEIAAAIGVGVPTVHRWARGQTTPRGRYLLQLHALEDVRVLLAAVFGAPEAARSWLATPLSLADRVAPRTLITAGAITKVVGILASLESGVYL